MRRDEEIADFNERCGGMTGIICSRLMNEIDAVLPDAQSRLYYANPVWFLDNIPVVGYSVSTCSVTLRFWNGQNFISRGLTSVGSFRAAEVKYHHADAINYAALRVWLEEALVAHRTCRTTSELFEVTELAVC